MEWPIWSRWSAYRETRWLICTRRNWKLSQSEIFSNDAGPFLKMSFLFSCFSHIFTIAGQLPGFFIITLANIKDFLNVNILFKFKYKCEYKRLFIWMYLCSMLPKMSFLLPHLFYNVELQFSWFYNTEQASEISILKIEMMLEFQIEKNTEIAGF